MYDETVSGTAEIREYYYVELEPGKYTTLQKLLICGFSVTDVPCVAPRAVSVTDTGLAKVIVVAIVV